MAVPDFQTTMRPIVQIHADGDDYKRPPLKDALARHFDLTDDDRAELLPSGRQRHLPIMIAHDVGVTTRQHYELKRIDEDYFLEGES